VLCKIMKKYWFLFILIVLTPILFNLLSIQQEYGLHRYYKVCGAQFDLWQNLLGMVLVIDIALLVVSYSVVFISLKPDTHERSQVQVYIILTLLVLLASGISGFGNFILDIQWSSILRDGPGFFSTSENIYLNVFLSAFSTACLLIICIRKGRLSQNDILSARD